MAALVAVFFAPVGGWRVCASIHSSNTPTIHASFVGSDPYCVFILGDEEIRSKCCENTNNPVWEPPDEFVMSVPDARYYLRVLLYDKGEPAPYIMAIVAAP